MKALKCLSLVLLFVLAAVSVMGVTFNSTGVTVDTDAPTTYTVNQLDATAPVGTTFSVGGASALDPNVVLCEVVSNTLRITPKVRSGSTTCSVTTEFNSTPDVDTLAVTVSRTDRLAITDVNFNGEEEENVRTRDVVVAGQTTSIVDGGSVDVKPGKTLSVEVEVRNLWPETFDPNLHEIKDVEVEAELDGIGDIDDEDENQDANDLEPDDDDKVTFNFDIPLLVGEDSGDLTITVKGDDRDGTRYSHRVKFNVNIDKENHKLDLKTQLSPTTMSCTRSGQLDVTVTNIGSNDEDIVQLLIKNDQLNLKFFETFELQEAEDEEDDDAVYKQTYNFAVPASVAPGQYPLRVSTFFKAEKEAAAQILTLTVQACDTRAQDTSRNVDNDQPRQTQPQQPRQTVDVVQNPQPVVGSQLVAQPVVGNRAVSGRETTTLSTSTVAMGVGVVVLLALVAVLVAVLVRRP